MSRQFSFNRIFMKARAIKYDGKSTDTKPELQLLINLWANPLINIVCKNKLGQQTNFVKRR